MKVKKSLQRVIKSGKRENAKGDPFRSFMVITVCALLAAVIAVVPKALGNSDKDQVYAASESENSSVAFSSGVELQDNLHVPTGIAGVISGVEVTRGAGTTVERIGTSCENVMVGQRVTTVEDDIAEINVSSSMESRLNDFDAKAVSMAERPKLMSDGDYDTLLRIVEAEAGGEDVKGRILVGNVIMNRVKSPEFPDNVTDVVWQWTNGVPQFSPTYDGRIDTVTVSDDTREAVKQVLEGVDYSEGALFFVEKAIAEKHNVSWFEKDLKKLFKYGVHDFYTYPAETDKKEDTSSEKTEEGEVVQMVKNDILE